MFLWIRKLVTGKGNKITLGGPVSNIYEYRTQLV